MSLPEKERDEKSIEIMPRVIGNKICSLQCFGRRQMRFADFSLSETEFFKVEIIDIWDMTRTVYTEKISDSFRVNLPAKERIAVLLTKL